MPINFNSFQYPQMQSQIQPIMGNAPQGQSIEGGIGSILTALAQRQAQNQQTQQPAQANALSQTLNASPQGIGTLATKYGIPQQAQISGNQNVSGIWNTAMQQLGAGEGDQTLKAFLDKSNPGLDPQSTPWCAGFVGSVLKANGINGTGSLAAKSYLNYGTPVQKPSQGDIVVFNDLTGRNDPNHGHVGFVQSVNYNNNTVTVLGGNQGNKVSVKTYPLNNVAGFRHPPSINEVQSRAAKSGFQSPDQLITAAAQSANSQPQNQFPGMISPGNINLNNRPIVKNQDGSYSTVRTITVNMDGKTVLLPTVINGKVVSNQDAINYYKKTGQNLGVFKDENSANQYDQQMHQNQGWTGPKNNWNLTPVSMNQPQGPYFNHTQGEGGYWNIPGGANDIQRVPYQDSSQMPIIKDNPNLNGQLPLVFASNGSVGGIRG